MRVWVYIILSAILQTLWALTLKRLDVEKILSLIQARDFNNPNLYVEFIPLGLYLVLGLSIVVFISKAYKLLPMSIVYAFWMGLTIVFQTLIDVFYFKEILDAWHLFFISCILIGIVGMKKTETKIKIS